MRDYENLNKGRNNLKNALFRMYENFKKSNVLCEVTKNLKNDTRAEAILKCFIQNARKFKKTKCFMRGYKKI